MYVMMLILLNVLNCFTFEINLKEKSNVVDKIVAHMISEFVDHNVMFHYENHTKHHVDIIVSEAVINGSIIFTNYDVENMLERPIGYCYLHVVLLEHLTRFKEYTRDNIFSLQYVDVILFIHNLNVNKNTKSDIFTYWPGHMLNKAGALFLFNVYDMTLFSTCFYCHLKSANFIQIATLTENANDKFNISVSLLGIYRNQFKDFNGHIFRVGFVTYKPFFWCKEVSRNDKTILYWFWGSEGALLVTLVQQLNMTFALTACDETENSWTKIIEHVKNGSLDWAVGGITLTIKRAEVVDFTNTVYNEAFTTLYSVYYDPWMSLMNFVLPFDTSTWIVLFTTILFINCIFFLSIYNNQMNNTISYFYFIKQGNLRILFEQPLPHMKDVLKTRFTTTLLLSCWLITALVLTNAYKSKLISSLIMSRIEEYNSIDELVEKGYNFYISNLDSAVIRENLENSKDSKFLETLRRARNDTEFCKSILQTSENKLAVIDEETNFFYSIQVYCRKLIAEDVIRKFRLTRLVVFPSTHAWPMALNTPYRMAINQVIARINAAGLLVKWNRDYTSSSGDIVKKSKGNTYESRSGNYNSFRLSNMIGPGTIWGVGIILAGIRFLWEIAKYRNIENISITSK